MKSNGDIESLRRYISAEEAKVAATPRQLPFSTKEYDDRRRRLQSLMLDEDVEVIVATSPATICWLTGYAMRWYGSGSSTKLPPVRCLVLHAEHEQPFLIDRASYEGLARLTSCVADFRGLPQPDPNQEPTAREFTDFLVSCLEREGWLGGTVGLELYSWVPSPAVAEVMVDRLRAKSAAVIDATRLARRARQIKSAAELEKIERAQECCDAGLRALQLGARPTMSGLEAWQVYMEGVVAAGGEPSAMDETIFAGPMAPTGALLNSHAPLSGYGYFLADVAASVDRYHSRLTRPYSFGPAPAELVRLTEIAAGALEVVRTEGGAGSQFATLKRALRDYYSDAGFAAGEYYAGGYELGLSFAPDWMGELYWASEDPDDDSTIPAGLVTHFESITFAPIVDTVVFEAGGARTLSRLPEQILIVG